MNKPALAVADLKQQLNCFNQDQYTTFIAQQTNDQCIADLISARTEFFDGLLLKLWNHVFTPNSTMSLLAVGGYGRGELHPYSDIDLLIYCTTDPQDHHAEIEKFLLSLWDMGLDIGHSVRNLQQCADEAAQDVTVMSTLLEARTICGNTQAADDIRRALNDANAWPVADFFVAKKQEQTKRYQQFHESSYRLEPNVKEGVGGLRDIQLIGWVAKRQFPTKALSGLVRVEFLTDEEYWQLTQAQIFLWRVRFALHMQTGRREDRLLFDQQLKLAETLGYQSDKGNLAVEAFMQDYFKATILVSRLNEILLQHFSESFLSENESNEIIAINAHFQIYRGYIETTHASVFEQQPLAMLELFHLMQQHPELHGVRANTIRQIRQNRHLIDEKFREDPRSQNLFMAIMTEPQGITHELRRMHRYGILARYIPAFANIVGRMQFDLFHAYTVDEHILFVLSNLRRLALERFNHELPYLSKIMQNDIPKPWLLYLAGLFHDIAKGRDGDHSELGQHDALEFCLKHGLNEQDSQLVSWLVKMHLHMSMTAQRKDISDPTIIQAFAEIVGSVKRLNYLFILTVSDIRGTNPDLWNSWRESLLKELYRATYTALEQGAQSQTHAELAVQNKETVIQKLTAQGITRQQIEPLWARFDDDYFARHTTAEIHWHSNGLLQPQFNQKHTLVMVGHPDTQGTSTIFVYTPNRAYLLGYISSLLDQLGLNIFEAKIAHTSDNYTLDSYVVSELDGTAIADKAREEFIATTLQKLLTGQPEWPQQAPDKASRRVRAFNTELLIQFRPDPHKQRTQLQIVSADRPGLLSIIGKVFQQHKVVLHNAKISTVGERAEDVFYITDKHGAAIDDPLPQAALREALINALEEE